MTDTTSVQEEMSRTEVAEYLRRLAQEFANEDDSEVAVKVGNKEVVLHPTQTLSCGTEVSERSSLLGSNSEEVTLTLEWSPSSE